MAIMSPNVNIIYVHANWGFKQMSETIALRVDHLFRRLVSVR